MNLKQKWYSIVTEFNKKKFKNNTAYICLGKSPWTKLKIAKPVLLLHGTKLFQIGWIKRK